MGMNVAGGADAACGKEEDGETLGTQMSAEPTLSKKKSRLEGREGSLELGTAISV